MVVAACAYIFYFDGYSASGKAKTNRAYLLRLLKKGFLLMADGR